VLNIHETYDSNTLRQIHPLSHTDKLFHQIPLALHLEYKYSAAEMDFLHRFDRQRLQALKYIPCSILQSIGLLS